MCRVQTSTVQSDIAPPGIANATTKTQAQSSHESVKEKQVNHARPNESVKKNELMKHSHKDKKTKGGSKGQHNNEAVHHRRSGPVMIKDILKEAPSHHKSDAAVRKMMIPTNLANDTSPVIKKKF
jgi:hypothetical protein